MLVGIILENSLKNLIIPIKWVQNLPISDLTKHGINSDVKLVVFYSKEKNKDADFSLPISEVFDDSFDGNDSEEELNAYLAACSSVTNQTVSNEEIIESKRQKIEALLLGFDGTEQPGSISVLQYWEENKHQKPELYRLASAIFTIPPTQTTVERAFSSFAIVFTSHRSRLNSNTLQNILLIRLNYDIYAENLLNYDFENNDILCNNN